MKIAASTDASIGARSGRIDASIAARSGRGIGIGTRLLVSLLTLLLSGCSLVGAPGRGTPDGVTAPRDRPATGPTGPGGPGGTPPLGPRSEEWAATLPTSEVRALWVVRTSLVHADSIRVMVRRAAEAGFNTLLVQVRGRGDAFYSGGWEPRAQSLARQPREFDPLSLVISEAHARGLSVHAWLNTHLVGGMAGPPSALDHLVNRRPDLLSVPKELARELYDADPTQPGYADRLFAYAQAHRDRVEGVYSSPAHPEVKELIHSIWMDLVDRYELDGMHFDYIRYPGPEFGYSRTALKRFREWARPSLEADRRQELERAFASDPLAYVEALPDQWNDFRREQITDLVRRIYYGVKLRRPGILVSAAVFANAEDAYLNRFQDWRSWLREGYLDVAVPMAYTARDDAFTRQIGTAVDAAEWGRRVWAGIGAYQNSFEGTIDKIQIARSLNVGGVILFSYDWAVHEGRAPQGAPYLQEVGRRAFGGR